MKITDTVPATRIETPIGTAKSYGHGRSAKGRLMFRP
jgi:hypothetical protein